MRSTTTIVCGTIVAVLGGLAAFAQRESSRNPAPVDKALALTAADVNSVAQELESKKETTHQFFAEKTYNMEVRRLVGPQPILLHAHKSDFMVIRDGEGTFVTGGELVNGKPGGGDPGDMRGESIRGGVSRVLKAGDVVFVPAGIPHAFVETRDHVTFVMTRYDTK